jgi:transposase
MNVVMIMIMNGVLETELEVSPFFSILSRFKLSLSLFTSIRFRPMARGRHSTRLRAARRQHPLTPALRHRIIEMHTQDNLGAKKITKILLAAREPVARSTIQRLLTRFNRTGEILSRPKGGIHPDQRHPEYVRVRAIQLAEENSERTVGDVKRVLDFEYENEEQYISPCHSTIEKWLHSAHLSTKTLYNRPLGYNSDSTKHLRFNYIHDVADPLLTAENTVYIDETPFAIHTKRHRGWSRIGSRAFRSTSTIRGTNHSVIAAISPIHGLLHFKIKRTEESEEYQTKGVGAQVFLDFSKELLRKPPLSLPREFYFIAMDNVGFHKNREVVTLYNKKHKHTLLPPYSPFLNPIEFIFSQWKSIFKGLPHSTDEEVWTAIENSAETLNEDKQRFLNCFRHTRKFHKDVLEFKSIDA